MRPRVATTVSIRIVTDCGLHSDELERVANKSFRLSLISDD